MPQIKDNRLSQLPQSIPLSRRIPVFFMTFPF